MPESPPLPPAGERRFNPFSEANRNSFPSIDNVFRTGNDCKSVCSQGSFHGSSFLNLSIGAFAALGDHMRHVAKYGIDGEEEHDDAEAEDTEESLKELRNPLDKKWDYLLDHSNVNVDGSFAVINENAGVDISFAATDTSNDFFNTSRVKDLATPDRNKDVSGVVMARGEEYAFDEEESFDAPSPSHLAPPEVVQEQHTEEAFPRSFSFNSLNNVDISRISNADCPDYSFQEDPEDAFNFLDIASPGSRIHDSSFSSTPRRHPPPSQDNTPKLPSFFSSTDRRSLPPRRFSRSTHDKENSMNRSFEHSSGRTKKPSPLSALGSLPRGFLRALGARGEKNTKVQAPSPIPHSKTTPPSPVDISATNEPSLSGRRKYRTVVPRRVFLDSPSDYPEEQDSFSAILQDDDDGVTNESPARSLMDSFEAVYER
jgi:hypothetical protein